jgi:hypothetical protein
VTTRVSLLDAERARRPEASDAACIEAITARLLGDLDVDVPPVDVEMVASALGIAEIRHEVTLVESGCLINDSGRLLVCLRATDAYARQRFTLCHESTHTFFPGFERTAQYRCSPSVAPPRPRASSLRGRPGSTPTGRELEALCDLGASALLLPRHLFADRARHLDSVVESVEHLAARFEASLEATARRFVTDRDRGEAFLVLKVLNKPRDAAGAAPKLRVATSTTSQLTGWIPQYKSAEPDGPFGRALQGEIVDQVVQISDVLALPRRLRVSARPYPYTDGDGRQVQRVLALLSHPTP